MNADKLIKEILDKYGESFADNTWVVPGGKTRAIYHKTIERIATKAGVHYFDPVIISPAPDNVVIIVRGMIENDKDRLETWSFGECSPKNNKNAYPYSMAEKRGKDRVALKLIGLHGLLYSEEEAEDFKAPDEGQERMAEARARDSATAYVSIASTALRNADTEEELDRWWGDEAKRREEHGVVKGTSYYDRLVAAAKEHKATLKQKAAA
jgi:hypothetical protein